MTLSAWSRVLEVVTSSSDQCKEIVALSYMDLPHYLILGFFYFGLFQTDYEIHAGRLARLWIAEGFIQQRETEKMKLEDIAGGYLEELVSRYMIQVANMRSNGTIRTCRVHVIFHEFTISEAGQNDFFIIQNDKGIESF